MYEFEMLSFEEGDSMSVLPHSPLLLKHQSHHALKVKNPCTEHQRLRDSSSDICSHQTY